MAVASSYGVDKYGNKFGVDIRDGVSYVAGTMTRPPSGSTIQTAGGIYQVGSDYKGTLVANHNMVPVEDKVQQQVATGVGGGTPIYQQQQQNTNITPTGGAATNTPVTPAPPVNGSTTGSNANGLADIVYLPDGSAQQNTLATSGIDNTTLVTGGLVVLVVMLFRWLTGGKK